MIDDGERLILAAGPPASTGELYQREDHLARYRLAAERCAGRSLVVDLACGSGYGSAMLAEGGARRVLGLDLAPEAAAYARRHWGRSGLDFAVGDATAAPLADGTVSALTQFETLEHVPDPHAAIAEAARLLAPGGLYLASTPNLLHSARAGDGRLLNPHHHVELTPTEFVAALTPRFEVEALYGQVYCGPRARATEGLLRLARALLGEPLVLRLLAKYERVLGRVGFRYPWFVARCAASRALVPTDVAGLVAYRAMVAVCRRRGS